MNKSTIIDIENLSYAFLREPTEEKAVSLLRTCRIKGSHSLGVYLGKHFANIFPFSYSVLDEYAICAYWANELELSFTLYEKILAFPHLTEEQIKHINFNTQFCVQKIRNRYTYYNKELVQRLTLRSKNPNPFITLTMTTCKRFDLFEKTVNSFLNACEDVEKIDEWFVVDDNSSEEDRQKMKDLYPFITFYFKKLSEKGHPQSMNIILNNVNSPYLFHMEDDFQFFVKRPLITECMSVLSSNPRIGQCLINRIYSETEHDPHRIIGGEPQHTSSGVRYLIHEFAPKGTPEFDAFTRKYGACINEAYWPHFSFRPGLNKFWIWKDIGNFNETISHFEMEYAYRYISKGYVTAFFDTIGCLHTGRLTSERNNTNKKNAYELNDEAQFSGKEEKLRAQTTNKLRVKTLVLNLDRRMDRWDNFKENEMSKISFLNPVRYVAVDGKKLKPTFKLLSLFCGNDYNYRRGMIGCALSHLKMWKELVEDKDNDCYVVLEDDVSISPNFKLQYDYLLRILPSVWDLIYLGASMRPHYIAEHDIFNMNKLLALERWNTKMSMSNCLGGTIGYMINKSGAKKMLEFIEKTRMSNCIDTMMQKNLDNTFAFYPNPHLIKSEVYGNESVGGNLKVDTDIGNSYDSLKVNEEVKKKIISAFLGNREEKIEEKVGSDTSLSYYPIDNLGVVVVKNDGGLFNDMNELIQYT